MRQIKYRAGYRYQLAELYTVKTPICPDERIETDFIALERDGTLVLNKGYACDGPSFPAIPTRNFMRGAFIHDAFYQLLRLGLLDPFRRLEVDKFFQQCVIEDGMSAARAWWVFHGVNVGAGPAADPANDKPVLYAP